MSYTSSVEKIAQKMAYADIATQVTNLSNEQADLDAQSSALDTLSSSLEAFQSAADALNSDTDGPVAYSATSTNEGNTASANSEAQPGTYSFYVSQLATAEQQTYNMTDGVFSATGTFELTMGDSTMDIDLAAADQNGNGDGYIDSSELVDAINDSDDNPGVTAALVNTNGTTTIMLTADDTGAQGQFTVQMMGDHDPTNDKTTDANGNAVVPPGQTSRTQGQDAIIYLGGPDGPEITNSSNTFDDVIPGVTMTFTDTSDSEDDLTTFTVAEDTSTTQANVQTFVDAYNTLVDTMDSLTSNGSDGSSAGAFAGDAGLKSLTSRMDDIVHESYNGSDITEYGITLDSDGHLEIDSEQFSEAMKEDPDGLTSIFVGDDSMVAQMDDLMDSYLDSSTGIIASREQNIEDQQGNISDEEDRLKTSYDTNVDRYVKEFTNTIVEVYTMKVSMAAFA